MTIRIQAITLTSAMLFVINVPDRLDVSAPLRSRILAAGELLWDLLCPMAPPGRHDRELRRRLCKPDGTWTRFDHSLIEMTAMAPSGTGSVSLAPDAQPRYDSVAPVAWDRIGFTDFSLHRRESRTCTFAFRLRARNAAGQSGRAWLPGARFPVPEWRLRLVERPRPG